MAKWVVAAIVAVVLAVGAWAFQPWRLLTSSEVSEAAPTSAVEPSVTPSADPSSSADSPSASPTPAPARDRELARSQFEDAEHATSGVVRILELADGSRFVRFEGLDTSDGPDLHVWITDQPSGGEWGSYDDGRFVRLGGLKATRGEQNYAVPADVDLSSMTSVVIWCDRFNVAFGTAPVRVA